MPNRPRHALRRFFTPFTLVVLLSSSALAEAATGDVVVRLKDGAVYRAELVELVPNDHVTVKLVTGEVKRFPWRQVRDLEHVEARGSAASAPAPAAEAPAAAPSSGTPLLVVESDDPQTVVRQKGSVEANAVGAAVGSGGQWAVGAAHAEEWRQVCVVPCNQRVDARLSYRIEAAQGGGFPNSSVFVLPQGQDPVKLRVRTGSTGGLVGGIALLGLGIGGVLVGVEMFVFAALNHDNAGFNTAGAVSLGVGVPLVAIGLPLALASRTKVTNDAGEKVGTLRVRLPRGVEWTPSGFSF